MSEIILNEKGRKTAETINHNAKMFNIIRDKYPDKSSSNKLKEKGK